MTLREFYEKAGGDYEDVCSRLGSEEVVRSIVKMLLTDRHYERCKQALMTGDADAAFCSAHALKGICMNLDLRRLQEKAADLTEVLRANRRDMKKAPAAFSELQSCYLDTIDALNTL